MSRESSEKKSQYKLYWDDQKGVARIFIEGVVSEEIVEKICKESLRLIEGRGERVDWMVSLEKLTQPILSSRVRKMMVEAAKIITEGRVAMVGAPAVTRVITNFVFMAAGRKSVRFFKEEKKAWEWLEKKREQGF